jgi:hypothetical protein
MDIEEASGKIRSTHVMDDEEDYGLPVWAARYPVNQILGAAEECPRQLAGVPEPEGMRGYRAGRRLDDVLLEAYRITYPPTD